MYERLDACPLCQSTQLANERIVKDHSISGESFALSRCQTCDFLFTNPRPTLTDLGKYYESEDYISHHDEGGSLLARVYRAVRSITLNQKINLVAKHTTKQEQLLDVGCGTGAFLQKAKSKGWTVQGVEQDDQARNAAEQKLATTLPSDVFALPQEKQFDAITLWHVLEHLPQLQETLKFFRGLTTKKGRIFVAVPNVGSWDAKHYDEYWAGYDVPRHLYHFTQATFQRLLKESGFTLVETIPMKFDAFYVSLLSEQYQHGSKGYWQAFQAGRKSNAWAKQNNNNYSSLIYVIKKK